MKAKNLRTENKVDLLSQNMNLVLKTKNYFTNIPRKRCYQDPYHVVWEMIVNNSGRSRFVLVFFVSIYFDDIGRRTRNDS